MRFDVLLSATARHAHQPADLNGGGPIQVDGRAIAGLQVAVDTATVFLAACFGHIKMRDPLRFGRRGKAARNSAAMSSFNSGSEKPCA
ncbi:MAG TPA: hypothetical protein VHD36_18310 [Pirellulales bacterium]|nr:hypothetical protein [Pirellulales bacterium]